MNRKRIGNQAASYLLAGLLVSMVVTFIAFDVKAVRREASFQNEGQCSTVAVSPCPGHTNSIVWGVPGVLIASAE
jgi:hypothetical protein